MQHTLTYLGLDGVEHIHVEGINAGAPNEAPYRTRRRKRGEPHRAAIAQRAADLFEKSKLVSFHGIDRRVSQHGSFLVRYAATEPRVMAMEVADETGTVVFSAKHHQDAGLFSYGKCVEGEWRHAFMGERGHEA